MEKVQRRYVESKVGFRNEVFNEKHDTIKSYKGQMP